MCGRFVRHSSLRLIEQTFNVDTTEIQTAPSYNITPTQEVLAVVDNGRFHLTGLHWGLVPFWSKNTQIGSRMINARAETVAEKPSFRNAFKQRRCLIVADGFYEWKGAKGDKQPFYITLPDATPFGFAGLWEEWKANGDSQAYRSCAIITTEASESVRNIHHRMPVVLRPETHAAWLDSAPQEPDDLKRILSQGFFSEFTAYPVSRRVNSIRNNDAACIQPIDTDSASGI